MSDGEGHITAWLFAGGLASASVARALTDRGLRLAAWDDISVTVQASSAELVHEALLSADTIGAHPSLPADMESALKFGIVFRRTSLERS